MDKKHELLRQLFGYSSFRQGQEELIDAMLSGRDAFGIMPTGGGKSLCYQIPALMMPGVTLVISPLISLMKDQVMALKNAGIPGAFINSSLTAEQIRLVYRNLRFGMYKIIYVAPERLLTDGFLNAVSCLQVSMVAVDEAHCISQWGQDFRPSYLKITEFIRSLPTRPVVSAFTATATEQVRQDIAGSLELSDPYQIITGFDRPNLYFEVVRGRDKQEKLIRLLRQRAGKSGIVYCSTRRDVEKVCDFLRLNGFGATRYHAGLSEEERRKNQEDFIYDVDGIMVATNAFGMGIDKSNVSFVIHYNMPKSMEAYYQEAGRAGRDGSDAECILFFSAGDIQTAKFLIENSGDNEELTEADRAQLRQRDMERLEAMVGYCRTGRCLRGYILDYFGQPHEETCGNCCNCIQYGDQKDVTTEAKMILSCVKRIQDQLGYSVGQALVIRVLHGSKDKRIRELKLNTLSTYGLMSRYTRDQIRAIMDGLESGEYIRTDSAYNTVQLAPRAYGVLFGNDTVALHLDTGEDLPKPEFRKNAPQDDSLMNALKELRFQLARKENMPLYVIFSNATLEDMCAKKPRNRQEFLNVSGVGKVKAEKYAEAFLEVINRYSTD